MKSISALLITMHECPLCGEMCDCDGEDMFSCIPPDDCRHQCQDYDSEDYDNEWSEQEDFYGDAEINE